MRPMTPISIIVPIFNAAATLAESLGALCRELATVPGSELICIDNGSTDGSIEIIRSFPDAQLLQEPKRGAYAARNRGVRAARGDILAFTDPDCVPTAGWLRTIAATFEDDACVVALGMRRPAPDRGLNRLLGDYEVAKDRWVLSSNEPLKYFGFTNTMATRRSAWEQHGPFDERLRGSDTIFVRRIVDAAGCAVVRFVPNMRVAHLEIDGAVTYLKKTFIYGRSLQSYRRAVAVRPLTWPDRLQIFRATMREHHYGIAQSAALATLLVAGAVTWTAGRLAGQRVGWPMPSTGQR
jgi:glycosyltransferase involved in cell wall biosynthesis